MKVRIHTRHLDVPTALQEMEAHGFVAFSLPRPAQRAVAGAVLERLDALGYSVRQGEAHSPNFPMVIVDTARHDYFTLLKQVAEEDLRSL
jgi:hypothetical protein